MTADLPLLHRQYQVQARWTSVIREHIFESIQLPQDARALEVGSGTGVLCDWVAAETGSRCIGADIDPRAVAFAHGRQTGHRWLVADGRKLPLPEGCFDLVFCHYLLLWVRRPLVVLREMMRTLRRGGWLLALAEPDHAARIDYPEALAKPGELQIEALQRQGADVRIGRKLRALFASLDLQDVHSGLLGAQWQANDGPSGEVSEHELLRHDLEGIPTQELDEWLAEDHLARQRGERVLFVPTFYAYGRRP